MPVETPAPKTYNVPLETAPDDPAAGKKFAVLTWGCQMNANDSDQIENLMQADGLTKTDDLTQAKVIVLNTCSVRQNPEELPQQTN